MHTRLTNVQLNNREESRKIVASSGGGFPLLVRSHCTLLNTIHPHKGIPNSFPSSPLPFSYIHTKADSSTFLGYCAVSYRKY